MSKLIVIIGITGNQGGSVANTFLKQPGWRIRGLTRNTTSDASEDLTSKGIEMVQADLHDLTTLIAAFKGANLIFSVTDFWTPFFNPVNQQKAEELGISIGEYAYRLEVDQGKNIADAAADPSVLDGLDETGFIASTLSNARECSKGKYTKLWHFDSKADVFPKYVEEKHPQLAKKMSCMQTGYFMSSWRYNPRWWPGKKPDGSGFEMTFTTPADAKVPLLSVRDDTGSFVRALSKLSPGKTAMAAGDWVTWPEYIKRWADPMGIEREKVGYRQISVEEMAEGMGPFGVEVAEMYEYSGWPGYDGGMKILRVNDLREMGLDVPTTSIEEYVKKEDWSVALNF